ncbi:MAG: selenocysteine-specific translation elongation factor [Caldilineaceae bacterium]|nr:selenocysteine-specific translation elongation factor [Caldilineaceae bacterium]
MRVIATAGHVDHGKSTLVRALSGINPDRLEEEKRRGLTIVLGFAWMELAMPDGTTASVSIVDVPGHIDFIKNMLAGVGSVDAALLVIAADEGVMPQTREHLAILDLLALPDGVVALTKVDLVDEPEWLELVELDIHDILAGTCLEGAPIVRVSAETGAGLEALRCALAGRLTALPPARDRGRPRLPIDRIFSQPGFGTIVTGTLSDGGFGVGEAVEVLPDGPSGRVRALQSHKQSIERAFPGSRVAMNLSGVATDEVRRGQVVVAPGSLRATRLLDVSFRLLADAPKALLHNLAVDFFSGAAETPAHARLLATEELLPGEEGWLQLRLERPVLVAAGDRFILRQPSPSVTLGGGEILDPHPRRRYRRFDPAVADKLETLALGRPDEIVLQSLERDPLVSEQELIAASGLDKAVAGAAIGQLLEDGLAKGLDERRVLISGSAYQQVVAEMQQILGHFHGQSPLRLGMPRGEVRSRLRVVGAAGVRRELPQRVFGDLVMQAEADGMVAGDESTVRLPSHTVLYSSDQQRSVDRALRAYAAAPFSPPNSIETVNLLNGDEELLESLVERGILARLPGSVLFRAEDFGAAAAMIVEQARADGRITLADVRDLLATSRKYAQALLEELDSRRITRRVGDERVLLGGEQ